MPSLHEPKGGSKTVENRVAKTQKPYFVALLRANTRYLQSESEGKRDHTWCLCHRDRTGNLDRGAKSGIGTAATIGNNIE